ncbi:histidine phosphatase superfamily [Pavlovales sp. CCMP2436]|nr:histidine phosphatase superfamily [Pavlovales sp. CCMP2436]
MGVDATHLCALYTSTALLSLGLAWLSYRLHILDKARLPTYPKYLVLIRHAESEGNVDHDAYRTIGDPLIQLTPRGRKQAQAMAHRLRSLVGDSLVWAYVSPYIRARETAAIGLTQFAPEAVRLTEDPRLREQEFAGSFQQTVPSRSEQRLYGKFFYRFPGGESAADVYDRMSQFMDTLWRDMFRVDLSGSAVVIFAHGLTNRLFCMRWLHWSPATFESTRNPPNCGFLVLALQPPDASGHPFYRLTPESVAMLGLPVEVSAEFYPLEVSDPAESAPSSWALSRLYAPMLLGGFPSARSVAGQPPRGIAGGSGWRPPASNWEGSERDSGASRGVRNQRPRVRSRDGGVRNGGGGGGPAAHTLLPLPIGRDSPDWLLSAAGPPRPIGRDSPWRRGRASD